MKSKFFVNTMFKSAALLNGLGTIVTEVVVDKVITAAVGDTVPKWALTTARAMVASTIAGIGAGTSAALWMAPQSITVDESAIVDDVLDSIGSINIGLDDETEDDDKAHSA